MSYVPISIAVYSAALAGAIAGSFGENRLPEEDTVSAGGPVTNQIIAACAAFAQQMDITVNTEPLNSFNLPLLQQTCQGVWASRVGLSTTPGDYEKLCNAVLTLINATSLYLSGQSIVPLPPYGVSAVDVVGPSGAPTVNGVGGTGYYGSCLITDPENYNAPGSVNIATAPHQLLMLSLTASASVANQLAKFILFVDAVATGQVFEATIDPTNTHTVISASTIIFPGLAEGPHRIGFMLSGTTPGNVNVDANDRGSATILSF